ncbi:MAG: hypothetical protein HQL08_11350 [Nitrospirae bacterium]|nr:hypothetical protein [Nitrospirota bacterium]
MDKKFIIEITEENLIAIEFRTDRGEVKDFVVRLICLIHGRRHDVIRFDSAHGMPHMDILDAKGQLYDKVWYDYLSNDQALAMAIQDIKSHYEFYRERYIKWLRLN